MLSEENKAPARSRRNSLPAGPATLSMIRRSVLVNPEQALRTLHRRDDWEPPVRALLLAETHLRLHCVTADDQGFHLREAFGAAQSAQALTVVTGVADERLFAASAVVADIACCAGDPAAVAECTEYFKLAAAVHDEVRAYCAAAMRAVAQFHWLDCVAGRALLESVHRRCLDWADGADFAQMVADTLTVMALACDGSGYRLDPRAWAPVPGGMLHPEVLHPPARYLTSRLRRRMPAHTCGAASPPAV
ncbi:hypothetical protein [Actinoplanes aureus]|uniref:Uncharacterized protein n=1 Tax=Actinoplanes aureus TaxID=2792083 RepID=A0A931G185_9ACTN|nr:hypothetical protein [Actinoplanes aureus]MBG0564871.1 hypothetical protein [Actinoplanes aureus]